MELRASEYGVTDFHFHDDLLNGSRTWLDEFVQKIRHGRFTWESFFEPYGLDASILQRMRDAGCRCVKLGIQSFSPSLLQKMRRPPLVEPMIDTVVHSYRLGISTHYDMITGHPGETDADHERNLTTIEDLYSKTGDRLHFSLNPFILTAGSDIERHPERYGVTLRYAVPNDYAPLLATALGCVAPYPVGCTSDVPRETILRRMEDLSTILRLHGRDYLFLGRKEDRRSSTPSISMCPRHDYESPRKIAVRAARAAGDADLSLPTIVLRSDSNLRVHPTQGRVRVFVGPGHDPKAYGEAIDALGRGRAFRILGGEATLERSLGLVLSTARRHHSRCTLETNGLRFTQPSFVRSMIRCGLSHAVVLLLGLDVATADELGGVPGSFGLALDGARQLVAAGVVAELGVVLSERTLDSLPQLLDVASVMVPGHAGVRVVVADLVGTDRLVLPDPIRIESSVERLVDAACTRRLRVVVEDRR